MSACTLLDRLPTGWSSVIACRRASRSAASGSRSMTAGRCLPGDVDAGRRRGGVRRHRAPAGPGRAVRVGSVGLDAVPHVPPGRRRHAGEPVGGDGRGARSGVAPLDGRHRHGPGGDRHRLVAAPGPLGEQGRHGGELQGRLRVPPHLLLRRRHRRDAGGAVAAGQRRGQQHRRSRRGPRRRHRSAARRDRRRTSPR
jgi:hypothetical protein